MSYTDAISAIGVSLILTAFFLSIFNYVSNISKIYFFLNIIGGLFACYGSILLHSWPFIILEGTWSVVALIGLVRNIK